ncbi:MAG: hypothetical protein ABH824_01260 [Nanoarchaeota archaeon]|nr:hypothetical protein [Nanoarchaeota archaeon]MBU1632697.1 hypothetical protein [Nanoarchaeota archaeon]MBU1875663.1 hypothetical protein [Nanoarchaeota archaeon]
MSIQFRPDNVAFLAYAVQYEPCKFDSVRIDIFPYRRRQPIVMNVLDKGNVICRYYPYVPEGNLAEQISKELAFVESNGNKDIEYIVEVHGEISESSGRMIH